MPHPSDILPLAAVPPGHKPLFWEGYGLYVPQSWEIGRHEGDHTRGLFRVDNDSRVVIQARWWTAARPISFDEAVREHAEASRPKGEPPARYKPLSGLSLPAGEEDRAAAFQSDRDILVVWQSARAERVLIVRFLIEAGQPAFAQVRQMVSGLRLSSMKDPRTWAALDFAVESPAGYRLEEGKLQAGVCHLEFRKGRQRLTWRRFSAADAVMGVEAPTVEDLERWCRTAYAAEFFDMRYRVERRVDPGVRPLLRLEGSRRWLAPIEMQWMIPKHRRLPRRIDVIWDGGANKIYCIEIRNPSPESEPAIVDLEASCRFTLSANGGPTSVSAMTAANDGTGGVAGAPPSAARSAARQRSLDARVTRMPGIREERNAKGRLVLTHVVERPGGLRLLRLFGGLPAGPVKQERRLELDLIGAMVWEAAAKEVRVRDLIEAIRVRFRISYREAELSVTEFVKNLGARGILGVAMAAEE